MLCNNNHKNLFPKNKISLQDLMNGVYCGMYFPSKLPVIQCLLYTAYYTMLVTIVVTINITMLVKIFKSIMIIAYSIKFILLPEFCLTQNLETRILKGL